MKFQTVFVLMLLITAPAIVFAQPAKKMGEVYQIPFATSGNRIDLAVANSGTADLERVRVVSVVKPDWIRLDTEEVLLSRVEVDADGIASFGFSVDRGAPVGERGMLRFDIVSGEEVVGVKEFVLSVEAPAEAALDQNFPNPFSYTTTIGYDVPQAGTVQMGIYDMLGRRVELALDEEKPAGHHAFIWDASGVASGIYMYVLKTTGNEGEVQLLRNKMIVVR